MKVVVLISGGIDSIVVCKLIEKQGDVVLPLFINYGQLAAEKEWDSCQNLLEWCHLPKPTKMDLSDFGHKIPSGLTNIQKDIYQDAFLPGRNLLFLVVASSYAFSQGSRTVAIGLLSESSHLFPDQTQEFVVNTNFTINSAFGDNFVILTPLINFNKPDVIKLAEKFNIPLAKTYSCHSGKTEYCGKCVSCMELINTGMKSKIPHFPKGDACGK